MSSRCNHYRNFNILFQKGKFLDERIFRDERKVFDSFVVEKVLLAEMSGVMHWACLLGSVLSLKILLNQKDANVNEVDEVFHRCVCIFLQFFLRMEELR